jgi:peptidoglycan/LPS O-acetylase OafA/YrhL
MAARVRALPGFRCRAPRNFSSLARVTQAPRFAPATREPTLKLGAHLPALDGLRGIAILSVMFSHFILFVPAEGSVVGRVIVKLAHTGWAGVDLFFVLSGFLITGILADSRGKESYFRTFYMRRTLRIFPLYYAFLLLAFVVLPLIHFGDETPPASNAPWFVLYAANLFVARDGSFANAGGLGHLWSLAVEEQFYLVWPLVIYFLPPRAAERAAVAAFFIALAVRCGMVLTHTSTTAMFVLLPARFDALAAGGFIALRARNAGGVLGLVRPARVVLVLALAAIVAITATAHADIRFENPWRAAVLYSLLALFFGALLVLAIAAQERALLGRALTSRVLSIFGRYSYGLYVLHGLAPPLLALLGLYAAGLTSVAGALGFAAAAMAIAFAFAFVSFHAFEQRMLGLKRLFPYR